MRKIKELENRIKMLECGFNREHLYREGSLVGYERCVSMITLKCLHCNYELTRSIPELSKKEKEAAIRLGLMPKEQE